MPRAIAVKSVALIRRPSDGAIFVAEGMDDDGIAFHRLLGGSVEFGEAAADAVRREFEEELGLRIDVGDRVNVTENFFTWHGQARHEIVLVCEATFVDSAAYDGEPPVRVDGVRAITAWRTSGDDQPRLVPSGIELGS